MPGPRPPRRSSARVSGPGTSPPRARGYDSLIPPALLWRPSQGLGATLGRGIVSEAGLLETPNGRGGSRKKWMPYGGGWRFLGRDWGSRSWPPRRWARRPALFALGLPAMLAGVVLLESARRR